MNAMPNSGKELAVTVEGKSYQRIPVKTHVVQRGEVLLDFLSQYVKPNLQAGDMVAMSERVIAIMQGRSFPLEDIKPGPWARFLYKFVTKSPHGIGLASPFTMQKALEEVGLPRILIAALVAAITKPLGMRGLFYHVAGRAVAGIDGPCDFTLPPYNRAVTLAPAKPAKVAAEVSAALGVPFFVIDANDLGVEVLGSAPRGASVDLVKALFADNPLGQTNEQTPLAIIRPE
ncbi:MAG TPA: coenzyme F420-0:L-glutamate ligase [Verrucomicrobiae bacterium]|nr:coenzyme F420-0:L-glutamate ligase [Verrucomicrobiae bacterium]